MRKTKKEATIATKIQWVESGETKHAEMGIFVPIKISYSLWIWSPKETLNWKNTSCLRRVNNTLDNLPYSTDFTSISVIIFLRIVEQFEMEMCNLRVKWKKN